MEQGHPKRVVMDGVPARFRCIDSAVPDRETCVNGGVGAGMGCNPESGFLLTNLNGKTYKMNV